MANAAAGQLAKRDLDMCYFDGSAWSSENLISDDGGQKVLQLYKYDTEEDDLPE